MKKLLPFFAIILAASLARSQIINLTVTSYDGHSVASLTQGFEINKIGRVITDGTGAGFYYKDRPGTKGKYVKVSETVAQVATASGSVTTATDLVGKRIVLLLDASSGISVGASTLTKLNGESFSLPNNARIMRAWYEVQTTFTSAGDSATISLDIATDDVAGLLAAIAISDGSNPWDAGLHECIQTGSAANISEKSTASRSIQATIAKTALTAGKLALTIEYVVLN